MLDCRQGRYNLDPNVKFFATPPVHGSLARFVDHPADFCFKLPDALSYEQGAMVEPLSNAGGQRFCLHTAAGRAGMHINHVLRQQLGSQMCSLQVMYITCNMHMFSDVALTYDLIYALCIQCAD